MTIDTNIIIACLAAEPRPAIILSEWKQEGRALFVSAISITEVLSLPMLDEIDINKARAFLKNFIIVPFDAALAEIAASLRRTHHIEIPDAAIVATALANNVPLVTRDKKLKSIKGLRVIRI